VSSQPNNCGVLVPKFELHFQSSLFSLFYLATLTQCLSYGVPWGVILNHKGCKESVAAYFLDICVVKCEQFVSPDLGVLWQPIDHNCAGKYVRHRPMERFMGQRHFDNLAELQPCPSPVKVREGKWRSERQIAVEVFLGLEQLHVAEFTLRRWYLHSWSTHSLCDWTLKLMGVTVYYQATRFRNVWRKNIKGSIRFIAFVLIFKPFLAMSSGMNALKWNARIRNCLSYNRNKWKPSEQSEQESKTGPQPRE